MEAPLDKLTRALPLSLALSFCSRSPLGRGNVADFINQLANQHTTLFPSASSLRPRSA